MAPPEPGYSKGATFLTTREGLRQEPFSCS